MTRLLVFDSGVGGLSVAARSGASMPDAEIIYVADDAGFPYGDWEDAALTDRVVGLIAELIDRFAPGRRGHRLQHRLDAGAAAASRPLRHPLRRHRAGDQAGGGADAHRRGQRARHLRHHPPRLHARPDRRASRRTCHVRLVGSGNLAPYAERHMRGEPVDDDGDPRRDRAGLHRARRATDRHDRARLHPLSLSPRRISSGWRRGRSSGSTRRRRSRGAWWRSAAR